MCQIPGVWGGDRRRRPVPGQAVVQAHVAGGRLQWRQLTFVSCVALICHLLSLVGAPRPCTGSFLTLSHVVTWTEPRSESAHWATSPVSLGSLGLRVTVHASVFAEQWQ